MPNSIEGGLGGVKAAPASDPLAPPQASVLHPINVVCSRITAPADAYGNEPGITAPEATAHGARPSLLQRTTDH